MNAKKEFLKHIGNKAVKCAEIYRLNGWDEEDNRVHVYYRLKMSDNIDEFVKTLDFNYDAGYGGQELYGTIWFEDGSWSTRGEYDGSEWWENHSWPAIPEYLL